MAANMTRLAQVQGMSTRASLDRPRIGNLRWQNPNVQDWRLNRSQVNGFDGPATTVYSRGRVYDEQDRKFYNADFPRSEKVFSTGTNVKYLIAACRKADPNWQPSKFAKAEDRNHPMLKSRGLLG